MNVTVDWSIEVINADFVFWTELAQIKLFWVELTVFVEIVLKDLVVVILVNAVTTSRWIQDFAWLTEKLTLVSEEASASILIELVVIFELVGLSSRVTFLLALRMHNVESVNQSVALP